MNQEDTPLTEDALEEWLSRPDEAGAVAAALERVPGDLIVLGAGGKMGPTLARMARRAMAPDRRVIAVSRFSSDRAMESLQRAGVEVIRCDLLDPAAVAALPDAANVIFMAGQKFGTGDDPESTWMMNAVLPAMVAHRYPGARSVVFSTGCVYEPAPVRGGGSREHDPLRPPGEYAWSCVARERVFDHHCRRHGTPTLMLRLNYAVDLRYGVLHDVATMVWRGQPVDLDTGHVNVIWQGDANARALMALERAAVPAAVVNVTGRELVPVRWLAEQFGALLGREPRFTGAEQPTAWLADAARSFDWFGPVTVSLEHMIRATADWLRAGGVSLGKPTRFQNRDGEF